MLSDFLQFLFSGLTTGATFALVALGFTIIYNASHVINFAQGEFLMIGGMLVVPLALLTFISLKKMKLGNLNQIWQAKFTFDNYLSVLGDADTWISLGISVVYIAGSSAMAFGLGLLRNVPNRHCRDLLNDCRRVFVLAQRTW